jgi:hypothetical protein
MINGCREHLGCGARIGEIRYHRNYTTFGGGEIFKPAAVAADGDDARTAPCKENGCGVTDADAGAGYDCQASLEIARGLQDRHGLFASLRFSP